MDNLSVCLLNDSFPPVIDGVANTVKNYADIIQKKYGRATVATPYFPNANDKYPYEVLRYKSINTTKLVGYRAGNPFLPGTVDAITSVGPNIIHSHCPFASTYLARTVRGTLRVPVILTYHTMFDIDIAKVISQKTLQKAALHQLVANIEACDEVWVVSRGAGKNLKKIGYRGDYIIMENGVDFSKGRGKEDIIQNIYKKYNIPREKPVFLFVGRMMWYKGIRIIIDALSALKNENREFTMLFVGNGTDRQEIEKYAEKKGIKPMCRFVGAIHDREELRGFYSVSDLFLFPSTYDTNGLVVREAAACGVPSLLIEGSCAAEGVKNRETGFLAKENSADVARALRECGFDKEKLKAVGKEAEDKIYISWDTAVERAVKRYEYVIENFNSGRYALSGDRVSDEAFEAIGKTLEAIARAKKLRKGIINNAFGHSRDITSEIHSKIENRIQNFKDKDG